MNSGERDFMENVKRLNTVFQRVGRRNLHGEVSYCICFANRENQFRTTGSMTSGSRHRQSNGRNRIVRHARRVAIIIEFANYYCQVKSSHGQGSPVSHYLLSNGALRKLCLYDKNLNIINYLKITFKDFKKRAKRKLHIFIAITIC